MKNKHLKTGLTVAMMIGIFTTLVMVIINFCQGPAQEWFYSYPEVNGRAVPVEPGQEYTIEMDWKTAWICLTMMLVALVAWLSKLCIFCIPALRNGEDNAKSCLICNIFVGLGIIFAMIGFLLPAHTYTSPQEQELVLGTYWVYDTDRIIASTVLSWIGMPMAFIAAATNGFLALKNK